MFTWSNGPLLFIVSIVVVVIGWALREWVKANDLRHEKHEKHAADMTLHQTPEERTALANSVRGQLESHEALDAERFGHMNKTMDEIRADVKQLLKRPSGARRKAV